MFQLNTTNGSEMHIHGARFHVVACEETPETKAIGDRLLPLIADLKARDRVLADAVEGRTVTVAEQHVAERASQRVLTLLHHAAQSLDLVTPGLGSVATLFPEGYKLEGKQRGAKRLRRLEAIRQALTGPGLSGRPTLAAFVPRLDDAIARLGARLAARATADAAKATARDGVQAAKAEIRKQLDRSFGLLVALLGSRSEARTFFAPTDRDDREAAPGTPVVAAAPGALRPAA